MSSVTAPPNRETAACEHCGSPLAGDQRYCLTCGARAASGPVAPPGARGPGGREVVTDVTEAPPPPARDWTPAWTAAAVAALALVLIIGVLIGRQGSDGPQQAAAPIVRVGGAGAGGSGLGSGSQTADAGGAISEDWPGGKDGWTVELGAFAKDGASAAAIDKAKRDARGKGAKGVGVIDSDAHASLPGGSWLLYSGVYGSKAAAAKALGKLKGKFPDAQVVRVSNQAGGGGGGGGGGGSADASGGKSASGAAAKKAVQDLNQSGAAYEKQLKKKPKTIVIPGKPPPKDNKAPGGGSGGINIG